MLPWPAITDERLLARQMLGDTEFRDFLIGVSDGIGPRAYDAAALAHAYGYPWERPAGSYVLRGGEVTMLDEVDADARRELVAEFARSRHPIVAIGANGSPAALIRRFGRLPSPRDRDALVLTGALHDLDVGAIPTVTAFGYVPATLFESPGTVVRASVVWLTPPQVTLLTWVEIGYRLVRVESARFDVDHSEAELASVFAYVARLGAFCPEPAGEPVALAAVPATGRTAAALTQEELLEHIAPQLLGQGARAQHVVRLAHDDLPSLVRRARENLWPQGRPFPDSRMTPLPGGRASTAAQATAATLEVLRMLLRG